MYAAMRPFLRPSHALRSSWNSELVRTSAKASRNFFRAASIPLMGFVSLIR